MDSIALTPIKIVGKRYKALSLLGAGGMGIVYRAVDQLTGSIIALKQMTTPTGNLLFTSHSDSGDPRVVLAHEFGLLASLRHPNIISVLDYGFDEEQQPYYTMDLLENAETILSYGKTVGLNDQVILLTQLLRALAYLHRRGIIHRDLKPSNVMVVDHQPKVLDFGLSVHREQLQESDHTSGTLAYMAPEVLFGKPWTESADLYAVGVMAYEIILGRYPFDLDHMTTLIEQIQTQMPDFAGLEGQAALKLVLQRLLAKDAADRFGSVDEVLAELSRSINQPIPVETVATRESFLQGARFVGRERQIAQLKEALSQATQGKGQIWLIGGESGVGKSRLVEEIRVLAMVRGALVMRGQGVTEGGSLYHIWREPLRWLALNTEFSTLEASTLKFLVPDIGALLGRDIPDAAELDPRAMRDRLDTVIEDIFRRQRQPTVIVLEDLHFGDESSDLLTRLDRIIGDLPLLILGTYRDEEKPDLPKLVPNAHTMKLERLSQESISTLSESMLGAAGKQPQLVSFLQRETEGNVFFLIEVVRTLAEESGQLGTIGARTLPAHVFAGGIKAAVQRRLSRMPESSRPLLQIAAVYGRQLDVDFLRQVDPSVDFDQWLEIGSNANVFEVQNGQWRFAHDKLREGLLDELSPDQLRELHRRTATAIEKLHPDSPEFVSILAYHWSIAQDARKEWHYTLLAGENALRGGVSREVVTLFSRAYALDEQLFPDNAESRLRRARMEYAMGRAFQHMGDFDRVLAHVRRGLLQLGESIPDSTVSLGVKILREFGLQGLRRLTPGPFVRRTRHLDELTVLANLYNLAAEAYIFREAVAPILYTSTRKLNLSEMIGPSPQLAISYGAFSNIMGFLPWPSAAKQYGEEARNIEQALGDPSLSIELAVYLAAYNLAAGDFEAGRGYSQQAAILCEQLGNLFYLALHKATEIWIALYWDVDQERASQLNSEMYSLAAQNNYTQQLAWSLTNTQILSYRFTKSAEDLAALIPQFDPLLAMLEQSTDVQQKIRVYTLLAQIYLKQGNQNKALEFATRSLKLLARMPTTFYLLIPAISDLTETILGLLELNLNNPSSELPQIAKSATQMMRRHARVFRFGLPHQWMWQGYDELLHGNREKALEHWDKALKAAEQLGLRHEIAKIHYYWGKALDPQTPERDRHLHLASEGFQQMGMLSAYGLAQAALEGKGSGPYYLG